MAKSRLAALIWFAGLLAVAVQALAVASRYFQPWLSADYLYPQLFVEDVLAGRYPLAGWTLSSAPYFFPDMIGAIVLRAIAGPGTILPAYLVCSYLTLAVVAGWSLARATATGWSGWLGGVVLVNAILAWWPVGDHAHYLWLLGTAGFHGGAIVLGLANAALWLGDENPPGGVRWFVALAVLFVGMVSDTLFLTQAALPLGIALWLQADRQWRQPRVRRYLQASLGSIAAVVLVRLALAALGWFNFSRVVRYAPTPTAVGGAVAAFIRDFAQTLLPAGWGFALLALASCLIAAVAARRGKTVAAAGGPDRRTALWFGLVSVAATILFPLGTAYWRDAQHVRYVLPWLVLPGWVALAWMLPALAGWPRSGRALVATAIIQLCLLGWAWPAIDRARLAWPYSEQQARFDEFVAARHLQHGLSDYWHAHTLNTLTRAPVRLFPLRPAGNASFWNNNAYWFYDAEPATGRLLEPAYTFIVTDGLDEAALRSRFGPPSSIARVGELSVWLYDAPGSPRLNPAVERDVRNFLAGRPGESRIEPRK
ncbi:MAG TPA: hypothetical protein VL200_15180 [Lacunisphaera sp.]|jgi:hypothetical protein|nr:hypothetical protein [Lacunisphaera sp.]